MILLINPLTLSLTKHPPIGLGYISSVLKEHKYSVKILDLQFFDDQISFYEFIKDSSLEWVGISSSIQNQQSTKALINEIRLYTEKKIVIGGTFPSSLPEVSLQKINADIAVFGEAEDTIVELNEAIINNSSLHNIKGIIYKNGIEIIKNKERPLIADIDKLPYPDHLQLNPKRYSDTPWQLIKKGKIVGSILTSRGCPFHCTFCASTITMGNLWRPRQIKSVIDEMQYLHDSFQVDEFHVVDENIANDVKHLKDFCEEILKRKLKIYWRTPNGIRADLLDEKILALMKRSGCYMLGFGIESGSDKIRTNVCKKINIEKIKDVIKISNKLEILTFSYFILGLPGDTEETVLETIKFSVDSETNLAHFGFCVPYPGSAIYKKTSEKEKHKILSNAWHFIPFSISNVETDLLKKLHYKAYKKFYLRTKSLKVLYRVINIRTILPLLRIFLFYFLFNKPKPNKIKYPLTLKLKFFILKLWSLTRYLIEGSYKNDADILKNYTKDNNGKILDIGSGTGDLSKFINKSKYVGLELDLHKILYSKLIYPDKKFICNDILNENLSEYSCLIISKILHHMDDDDLKKIINKINQSLRKDGIVIIFEPQLPSLSFNLFHKFVCHIEGGNNHRSANSILQIFDKNKFSIIRKGLYKRIPLPFYCLVLKKVRD